MRGRLCWLRSGELPKWVDFERELTIGRSRDCGLQLSGSTISAHHARIGYDDGRSTFVLEDLGSRAGTELDGLGVLEPEPLGHLHVIRLGDGAPLLFQDLDLCAARHGGVEASPAPAAPEPAPAAPTEAEPAAPTEAEPAADPRPHTAVHRSAPPSPPSAPAEPSSPPASAPAAPEPPPAPGTPAAPEGGTRVVAVPPPAKPVADPESAPSEGTRVVAAPPPPLPSPPAQDAAPANEPEPPVKPAAASEPEPPAPPAAANEPEPPAPVGGTRVVAVPPPPAPSVAGAPTRSTPVAAGPTRFELVLEGGERFPLDEGEHSIGRQSDRDITCPDAEVSRLHATLVRRGEQLWIRDAGSHNGTFVDDRRIEGEAELRAGSRLRFGRQQARIEAAESATPDRTR